MADSGVTLSTSAAARTAYQQNKAGPYWYHSGVSTSHGNTYLVTWGTVDNKMHVLRASDPSLAGSWIEVDLANAPNHGVAVTGFNTHFDDDNGLLHVVSWDNTNYAYKYHEFNVATEAWDATKAKTVDTQASISGSSFNECYADISKRSDGALVVAYTAFTSTNQVYGAYRWAGATNWTAQVQLDDGDAAEQYGNPVIVTGESDISHVLFHTRAGLVLHYSNLSGGLTHGSSYVVTAYGEVPDTPTLSNHKNATGYGLQVRLLDSSNRIVFFPYASGIKELILTDHLFPQMEWGASPIGDTTLNDNTVSTGSSGYAYRPVNWSEGGVAILYGPSHGDSGSQYYMRKDYNNPDRLGWWSTPDTAGLTHGRNRMHCATYIRDGRWRLASAQSEISGYGLRYYETDLTDYMILPFWPDEDIIVPGKVLIARNYGCLGDSHTQVGNSGNYGGGDQALWFCLTDSHRRRIKMLKVSTDGTADHVFSEVDGASAYSTQSIDIDEITTFHQNYNFYMLTMNKETGTVHSYLFDHRQSIRAFNSSSGQAMHVPNARFDAISDVSEFPMLVLPPTLNVTTGGVILTAGYTISGIAYKRPYVKWSSAGVIPGGSWDALSDDHFWLGPEIERDLTWKIYRQSSSVTANPVTYMYISGLTGGTDAAWEQVVEYKNVSGDMNWFSNPTRVNDITLDHPPLWEDFLRDVPLDNSTFNYAAGIGTSKENHGFYYYAPSTQQIRMRLSCSTDNISQTPDTYIAGLTISKSRLDYTVQNTPSGVSVSDGNSFLASITNGNTIQGYCYRDGRGRLNYNFLGDPEHANFRGIKNTVSHPSNVFSEGMRSKFWDEDQATSVVIRNSQLETFNIAGSPMKVPNQNDESGIRSGGQRIFIFGKMKGSSTPYLADTKIELPYKKYNDFLAPNDIGASLNVNSTSLVEQGDKGVIGMQVTSNPNIYHGTSGWATGISGFETNCGSYYPWTRRGAHFHLWGLGGVNFQTDWGSVVTPASGHQNYGYIAKYPSSSTFSLILTSGTASEGVTERVLSMSNTTDENDVSVGSFISISTHSGVVVQNENIVFGKVVSGGQWRGTHLVQYGVYENVSATDYFRPRVAYKSVAGATSSWEYSDVQVYPSPSEEVHVYPGPVTHLHDQRFLLAYLMRRPGNVSTGDAPAYYEDEYAHYVVREFDAGTKQLGPALTLSHWVPDRQYDRDAVYYGEVLGWSVTEAIEDKQRANSAGTGSIDYRDSTGEVYSLHTFKITNEPYTRINAGYASAYCVVKAGTTFGEPLVITENSRKEGHATMGNSNMTTVQTTAAYQVAETNDAIVGVAVGGNSSFWQQIDMAGYKAFNSWAHEDKSTPFRAGLLDDLNPPYPSFGRSFATDVPNCLPVESSLNFTLISWRGGWGHAQGTDRTILSYEKYNRYNFDRTSESVLNNLDEIGPHQTRHGSKVLTVTATSNSLRLLEFRSCRGWMDSYVTQPVFTATNEIGHVSSVIDEDDVIHVAYIEKTTGRVGYCAYDVALDTWTTTNSEISAGSAVADEQPADADLRVSVTFNGTIVFVAYSGSKVDSGGTYYNRVDSSYSNKAAISWVAEVSIDSGGAVDWVLGALVQEGNLNTSWADGMPHLLSLPSCNYIAYIEDKTNNDLYYRVATSTNTPSWGTLTAMSVDTYASANLSIVGAGNFYTGDSTTETMNVVFYLDSSGILSAQVDPTNAQSFTLGDSSALSSEVVSLRGGRPQIGLGRFRSRFTFAYNTPTHEFVQTAQFHTSESHRAFNAGWAFENKKSLKVRKPQVLVAGEFVNKWEEASNFHAFCYHEGTGYSLVMHHLDNDVDDPFVETLPGWLQSDNNGYSNFTHQQTFETDDYTYAATWDTNAVRLFKSSNPYAFEFKQVPQPLNGWPTTIQDLHINKDSTGIAHLFFGDGGTLRHRSFDPSSDAWGQNTHRVSTFVDETYPTSVVAIPGVTLGLLAYYKTDGSHAWPNVTCAKTWQGTTWSAAILVSGFTRTGYSVQATVGLEEKVVVLPYELYNGNSDTESFIRVYDAATQVLHSAVTISHAEVLSSGLLWGGGSSTFNDVENRTQFYYPYLNAQNAKDIRILEGYVGANKMWVTNREIVSGITDSSLNLGSAFCHKYELIYFAEQAGAGVVTTVSAPRHSAQYNLFKVNQSYQYERMPWRGWQNAAKPQYVIRKDRNDRDRIRVISMAPAIINAPQYYCEYSVAPLKVGGDVPMKITGKYIDTDSTQNYQQDAAIATRYNYDSPAAFSCVYLPLKESASVSGTVQVGRGSSGLLAPQVYWDDFLGCGSQQPGNGLNQYSGRGDLANKRSRISGSTMALINTNNFANIFDSQQDMAGYKCSHGYDPTVGQYYFKLTFYEGIHNSSVLKDYGMPMTFCAALTFGVASTPPDEYCWINNVSSTADAYILYSDSMELVSGVYRKRVSAVKFAGADSNAPATKSPNVKKSWLAGYYAGQPYDYYPLAGSAYNKGLIYNRQTGAVDYAQHHGTNIFYDPIYAFTILTMSTVLVAAAPQVGHALKGTNDSYVEGTYPFITPGGTFTLFSTQLDIDIADKMAKPFVVDSRHPQVHANGKFLDVWGCRTSGVHLLGAFGNSSFVGFLPSGFTSWEMYLCDYRYDEWKPVNASTPIQTDIPYYGNYLWFATGYHGSMKLQHHDEEGTFNPFAVSGWTLSHTMAFSPSGQSNTYLVDGTTFNAGWVRDNYWLGVNTGYTTQTNTLTPEFNTHLRSIQETENTYLRSQVQEYGGSFYHFGITAGGPLDIMVRKMPNPTSSGSDHISEYASPIPASYLLAGMTISDVINANNMSTFIRDRLDDRYLHYFQTLYKNGTPDETQTYHLIWDFQGEEWTHCAPAIYNAGSDGLSWQLYPRNFYQRNDGSFIGYGYYDTNAGAGYSRPVIYTSGAGFTNTDWTEHRYGSVAGFTHPYITANPNVEHDNISFWYYDRVRDRTILGMYMYDNAEKDKMWIISSGNTFSNSYDAHIGFASGSQKFHGYGSVDHQMYHYNGTLDHVHSWYRSDSYMVGTTMSVAHPKPRNLGVWTNDIYGAGGIHMNPTCGVVEDTLTGNKYMMATDYLERGPGTGINGDPDLGELVFWKMFDDGSGLTWPEDFASVSVFHTNQNNIPGAVGYFPSISPRILTKDGRPNIWYPGGNNSPIFGSPSTPYFPLPFVSAQLQMSGDFNAGLSVSASISKGIPLGAQMNAGLSVSSDLFTNTPQVLELAAEFEAGVDVSPSLTAATTYDAFIDASGSVDAAVLVEIYLKEKLSSWSLVSGRTNTYSHSFEHTVQEDIVNGGLYRVLTGVTGDNVAWSSAASVAAVEGATGSFYFDEDNETLYTHAPDSATPDDREVTFATFRVHFATKPVVFNDIFYEPRISANSIPSVSQQTESLFFGTIKSVSSGSIALNNADNLFNILSVDWSWKNAEVYLYFGGSTLQHTPGNLDPGETEYVLLENYLVEDTAPSMTEFTVAVRDVQKYTAKKLPITTVTEDDYPNADPDALGAKLHLVYGYKQSVSPLLVDTTRQKGLYKLADNNYQQLFSIPAVYVDGVALDAADWIGTPSGCTFVIRSTYSGTTPAASSITCDVFGQSTSGLTWETSHGEAGNQQYLKYYGEIVCDIYTRYLDLPYGKIDGAAALTADNDNQAQHAIDIQEEIPASEIIRGLELGSMGRTMRNAKGQIQPTVWTPSAPSDAVVIDDYDIEDYSIDPKIEALFSRVIIEYDTGAENISVQTTESESLETKYYRLDDKDEFRTVPTYLANSIDAVVLAGRIKFVTSSPTLRVTVKETGIGLMNVQLGQKIKLTLAQAPDSSGSFDEVVFDVVEFKKEFVPRPSVEVVLESFTGSDLSIGTWSPAVSGTYTHATVNEQSVYGWWTTNSGLIVPSDPSTLDGSVWW